MLDYSYINKDGFMTYEFKLSGTGLDIPESQMIESQEIINLVKNPPILEDDTTYDNVKRKRRSAVFRKYIKQIYNNKCAVCGKTRLSKTDNPEVEAAYIYPKSKNGADDIRNGISLCRIHHWAFDNGYFTINNDYEIVIYKKIENDKNFEEILLI